METIYEIQRLFDTSKVKTEILAASFRTARDVIEVALRGAMAATVSADIMKRLLSHTVTDISIETFAADWRKAFGEATLNERLK